MDIHVDADLSQIADEMREAAALCEKNGFGHAADRLRSTFAGFRVIPNEYQDSAEDLDPDWRFADEDE